MNSSYRQKKEQLLESNTYSAALTDELLGYGYQLDEQGAHDHADMVYRDVADLLEELYQNPSSTMSCIDYARCAYEHGKSLYILGRKGQARASLRQAVDAMESNIQSGVTAEFMDLYARSLRWLALAQFQTGDEELGIETFQEAIQVYKSLLLFPKSLDAKKSYQRALRSIARVYEKLGIKDLAFKPNDKDLLQ